MVGMKGGVRNRNSYCMSENSAYRNQAWGCCYAGAEGKDLALPLELGGLAVGIAALDLDVVLRIIVFIVHINLSHHLHLTAAL